MGFDTFFQDFYCLPIRDILILAAVATWFFLELRERFQCRLWWKLFLFVCLSGCVAVILYQTVWNRNDTVRDAAFLLPFHSYREVLQGGNPEILRSSFMNVVFFYPAGLLAVSLMPEKWPRWLRAALPVLLLTLFSVGVEYWQYTLGLGLAEADDVIHNGLGALLGCRCGLLSRHTRK